MSDSLSKWTLILPLSAPPKEMLSLFASFFVFPQTPQTRDHRCVTSFLKLFTPTKQRRVVCVLAVWCPHLTGKDQSLVPGPGHTISCTCCKDEIRIQFCGAMYIILLWSVLHGFYQVVSFTGCDVLGIRLATLRHDGLLLHTWTSHCTEKSCL